MLFFSGFGVKLYRPALTAYSEISYWSHTKCYNVPTNTLE